MNDAAVAERPPTVQESLQSERFINRLAMALPKGLGVERMAGVALTALSNNSRLAETAAANPRSFFTSLLTAAGLGLEPNTPAGQCFLIPRRVKGTPTVMLQVGYKGWLDLLWRSNKVRSIRAEVLYAGDTYEERLDRAPKYVPVPPSERGEIVGAFAVIITEDGGFVAKRLWKEEIDDHAKRHSDAFNKSSSPWKTDWPAMACKTVLLQTAKWAPLSADLHTAVATEERAVTDHPVVDPVINANAAEAMDSIANKMAEDQMDHMLEEEAGYTGEDEGIHPADEREAREHAQDCE